MSNSLLLILGLGLPGGGEWIIIALVVLLLFGGRKIPELMKGLGKGVKSFKQGMNEVQDEVNKAVNDDETAASKSKEEDAAKTSK